MRPRQLLSIFGLIAFSLPVNALQFTWGPPLPFVYIKVGSQGNVETVTFTVPAGQAGSGTAIAGSPTVEIRFIGRRFRNGPSSYIVTMDSSAGLINGTGGSMPFSDFSWTTRDGEFPDGQFDDSANQILTQYTGPFLGFEDLMTFSYANTSVYPEGTYTGRITYTITHL